MYRSRPGAGGAAIFADGTAQGGQPADDEQMLANGAADGSVCCRGSAASREMSQQLSGAGAPDPLVQLKEAELQQGAASDQADQQIDQAKVQLDAQNQQMRSTQFKSVWLRKSVRRRLASTLLCSVSCSNNVITEVLHNEKS
jgi:hypothetical protein